MADKVSNQALLEVGIAAMKSVGKQMEKIPTSSRAMKYQLGNGETVRVRTCNDHVLVVLADSTEDTATLNIEGTDYLLIVMPEVPRVAGPVIAYFVPTSIAVSAVRQAHTDWLNSKPSTKGNNRTWNIWFDDGPPGCSGFAARWAKYRLPQTASPFSAGYAENNVPARTTRQLGVVIAEARKAIAEAAGVEIEAVKISVELD